MTQESATLEIIAAQVAELLELTEQTRADVREMHAAMDRIEGHLQRIGVMLQEAIGRGGEGREAVQ